ESSRNLRQQSAGSSELRFPATEGFAAGKLTKGGNDMQLSKTRSMLMVSAIIMFFQSLGALAHASATVDIQQVSGDSAQATFHSVDSTGCIVTDTFVSGSVGEVHNPPSGPADFQAVSVGISQFDQCRGLLLMSAAGTTDSGSFSFANDMSTASLTATIPVDEFVSGTNFQLEVTIS